MNIIKSSILIAFLLLACNTKQTEITVDYDICIYGATSGGIAAAIQASRMGKSVVILEATRHIGGLTTGGLGQTDIGNKQAIGGISREFYQQTQKTGLRRNVANIRMGGKLEQKKGKMLCGLLSHLQH